MIFGHDLRFFKQCGAETILAIFKHCAGSSKLSFPIIFVNGYEGGSRMCASVRTPLVRFIQLPDSHGTPKNKPGYFYF